MTFTSIIQVSFIAILIDIVTRAQAKDGLGAQEGDCFSAAGANAESCLNEELKEVTAALSGDDQCGANGGGCALNALQMKKGVAEAAEGDTSEVLANWVEFADMLLEEVEGPKAALPVPIDFGGPVDDMLGGLNFVVDLCRHLRHSSSAKDKEDLVTGYVEAFQFLTDERQFKRGQLTESALLQAHRALMKGEGGAWRDGPVRAGDHYFPEAEYVDRNMKGYLSALQHVLDRKDLSVYGKAAWAAYHLVSIHPFEDGNGRLSRVLANAILNRRGFPLFVALGAPRDDYVDSVQAVVPPTANWTTRGNLVSLTAHFRKICEQAVEKHKNDSRSKDSPWSKASLAETARQWVATDVCQNEYSNLNSSSGRGSTTSGGGSTGIADMSRRRSATTTVAPVSRRRSAATTQALKKATPKWAFQMVSVNKPCPDGYRRVASKEECSKAAHFYDWTFTGETNYRLADDHPYGCFMSPYPEVNWNPWGLDNGEGAEDAEFMCFGSGTDFLAPNGEVPRYGPCVSGPCDRCGESGTRACNQHCKTGYRLECQDACTSGGSQPLDCFGPPSAQCKTLGEKWTVKDITDNTKCCRCALSY